MRIVPDIFYIRTPRRNARLQRYEALSTFSIYYTGISILNSVNLSISPLLFRDYRQFGGTH